MILLACHLENVFSAGNDKDKITKEDRPGPDKPHIIVIAADDMVNMIGYF